MVLSWTARKKWIIDSDIRKLQGKNVDHSHQIWIRLHAFLNLVMSHYRREMAQLSLESILRSNTQVKMLSYQLAFYQNFSQNSNCLQTEAANCFFFKEISLAPCEVAQTTDLTRNQTIPWGGRVVLTDAGTCMGCPGALYMYASFQTTLQPVPLSPQTGLSPSSLPLQVI